MIKTLILPDIHGRYFWKSALEQFPIDKFPDLEIIFLGDYLDPYTSYDNITKEEAYIRFIELLDVTKDDPRITLLIGNHDWHYFVNLDMSRIDIERMNIIKKIFKTNIDRFKLVKTYKTKHENYLFTHAGITEYWLKNIIRSVKYLYRNNSNDKYEIDKQEFITNIENLSPDKENNYDFLNNCLKYYDDYFYQSFISMIGTERGGRDDGSLIWADIHEHFTWSRKSLPGYFQIFGHTITYPNGPKSYFISDSLKLAMLDASQTFVIDEDENEDRIIPLLEYNEHNK